MPRFILSNKNIHNMKNYFKYENDDQAREYMKSLVGKKVNAICTGVEVVGTAVAFRELEHSFELDVEHRPINWGGDYFTKSAMWCRKGDGFGPSKYLAEMEGEVC